MARERGARESRAGGPSRARALTRHVTQSEIRPTRSVQSAEGKGAAGRSSNPMFGKDRTNRKIERAVGPTFFHSAATCLHVPIRLTREATKHEGRKPRTSERHVVGCCEELAGW